MLEKILPGRKQVIGFASCMKLLFNSKVLFLTFLLLFTIPIFQYRLYWLLVDTIGVGFAYSTDQLSPLIVSCVAAFVVVKKYVRGNVAKRYISTNRLSFLIIIASALLVHGWMLGNYFMGEEPTTILSFINDDSKTSLVDGILRGYHYGIYVLSYQLFYTKVILYNAVSLVLYILTAIIFYVFLTQVFKNKTTTSLVGALFFVTTPAYMDMFFWQSNISGMPTALSAGLLSLIFLSAYQKNHAQPIF